MSNLESQINLSAFLWSVGVSRSTQKKPIQAWREHAISTLKGTHTDSNPGTRTNITVIVNESFIYRQRRCSSDKKLKKAIN